MNKSGIEYCDHTFNIVTGCKNSCPYCYARSMSVRFAGNVKQNKAETEKYRKEGELYILDHPFLDENGRQIHYPFGFEPTYHRYRFDVLDKLKMGNNIFVGAMADLFGQWVPDEALEEVMQTCLFRRNHNYLFLTKNPERYKTFGVPSGENMWYGTTVTSEEELFRIGSLPEYTHNFISIEPLLGDLYPENHLDVFGTAEWIIIGAETGKRKGKVVPEREWINKIVRKADSRGIPVFMKDSLIGIVGEENMRRDFPEQLKRKAVSKKLLKKLNEECMECGKEKRKSEMVGLTARTKRSGKSSVFGYMCKSCFRKFCRERNVQIPDLEGLKPAVINQEFEDAVKEMIKNAEK